MERTSKPKENSQKKREALSSRPENEETQRTMSKTTETPCVKETTLKGKNPEETHVEYSNQISEKRKLALHSELLAAKEIALTLTFSDGSSLLKPAPENGKRKSSSPLVTAVQIVYPCGNDSESKSLAYVKFVLDDNKRFDDWSREMLEKVMNGKSRKICYKAMELIIFLLKHTPIKPSEAILRWSVLDPGIALWLLQSDHPPQTFQAIMYALRKIDKTESSAQSVSTCEENQGPNTAGLEMLGPVMMELYNRLRHAHLWDLFTHIETPLIPILAAMHLRGIKVDTEGLLKMGNLLERKLGQLEEAAHTAAFCRFSLNSHVQLRQVLFEKLRLHKKLDAKIPRTCVGGHMSTSESVLAMLSDAHPLPSIVLEYRQLQKLKSTYVDGMLGFVRPSGSLHTHWDQLSAATGRLASAQPNIQAVPKQPVIIDIISKAIVGKPAERVELVARDPFICQKGFIFLAADYQQIEFRLLAHLCSDPGLLQVFSDAGETDIFVQLTSQWLHKEVCDVTAADRENTKKIVYAVIYGAGKERLSEYLHINSDEAKGIIQSFLVTYPGVSTFSKTCIDRARKQGYQTTLFGRRRHLPLIDHPSPKLRAQAERQATNFCVQGSAADLCKAAMVQVERELAGRPNIEARLLVQIHDELLFEVKRDHLHQSAELIQSVMEDTKSLCGGRVQLKVPLKVSLTCGAIWGKMEPHVAPGRLHTEC